MADRRFGAISARIRRHILVSYRHPASPYFPPMLDQTKFAIFVVHACVWAGLMASPALAEQPTPDDTAPRDATIIPGEVAAVFQAHCLKCHGKDKKSGKLDLRTMASIKAGGKTGAVIATGRSAESRLIELVQPGAKPHMPPGKKQLTPQEISLLTEWVDSLSGEGVDRQPESADVQSGEGTAADAWPASTETGEGTREEKPASNAIPAGIDPTLVIDLLTQSRWVQAGVTPAAGTSDAQFVRRAYLDLAGRIPTVAEVQTFLRSTDSSKRSELIDDLVDSADFANHFALSFDTLLMGRNERKYDRRIENGWHQYLQRAFEQNKPWNEVAREVLLARGTQEQRGHLWFLYERNDKHQDIAEGIAKGFFGIDIACAQCHDHPLADEILQEHYWGLVAFFNRSKNKNGDRGLAVAESAIGGFGSFSNALTGDSNDTTLTFFQANVVPESRPDKPDKQEDSDEFYVAVEGEPREPIFSRREKFVDEILDEHPLIARNIVNRVWGLLMGRGIVHPVDQMDSTHPPSHPELLDWLADDLTANEYRLKRLVRAIAKSRVYQLDSRRPAGDPLPELFAYGLEKPLTAEQFTRSLTVLVGKEADVDGIAAEFRKLFPDVLPENSLTTLKQTLMLSNYPRLQELFAQATVGLSSGNPSATIDGLFQQVFARAPTDAEREACLDYLSDRQDRLSDAWSQVLWALATSAEFRFNH